MLQAISAWLDLLRARQWYKNLVFLAAAFFSKKITDPAAWPLLAFGFLLLCLLSSGAYAINDWRDLASDRRHPRKKSRPLPSGRINPLHGLLAGVLFLSASVLASFLFLPAILPHLALLALLMLAYTFFIKRVWLADTVLIASNFLLRADAGAAVLNVPASPWFVLGIFAAGLFLALRKRLMDLSRASPPYKPQDKPVLQHLLALAMVFLLVVYSLFVFQSPAANPEALMLSIPFAFFIALRYYGSILRGAGAADEPLAPVLADRVLVLALAALLLILLGAYYL